MPLLLPLTFSALEYCRHQTHLLKNEDAFILPILEKQRGRPFL